MYRYVCLTFLSAAYRNYACLHCLFQYESIRSPCSPNYNKIVTSNKSIIQIRSHAENKSLITYCSNQVQRSFLSHLITQNNIPILSAHFAVTSSQNWNPRTVWLLVLWFHTWSNQRSTYCIKNKKNLIFSIYPIQTAVKKIINTIFSKQVKSVALQSDKFVIQLLLEKWLPSSLLL